MRSDDAGDWVAFVHPDVLAIAVALCGNREAIRQATRIVEHEAHIKTEPTQKIVEWSISIVSELKMQQRTLGG